MSSKQQVSRPTTIHLDRHPIETTFEAEEHRHLLTPRQIINSTQTQQQPTTVLALQHTLGNKAVQRLLSNRTQQTQDATDPMRPFDLASSRDLKAAEAPDRLTLPGELQEGLKQAWDNSFPDGKAQEQGGILVKTENGSHKWKRGEPGTSKQFIPDYSDKAENEALVGVGHTHAYDEGFTDVPFSDHDLAQFIFTNNRINVVRSGNSEFLVARTQEFDKLIEELNPDAKMTLYKEMRKLYDDTFKATRGTPQEQVEAAVKAVCSQYHLVYYKGNNGSLERATHR